MAICIGPLALLVFGLSVCAATNVQEDVVKAILEKLLALEAKVSRQDAEIKQLQNELKEERKLSSVGNLEGSLKYKRQTIDVREGPVAFTAAIKPRAVDHVHVNSPMIFETVLTNFANGYDNTTGTFTVPLTGIYLFSCSVLDHMSNDGHGSTMLHAEMVKNGVVMARVFAHANSVYRDQGAQTVVVEANKGDTVWVRTVDNNDLGLGGELYTTFSGYMLWQTG